MPLASNECGLSKKIVYGDYGVNTCNAASICRLVCGAYNTVDKGGPLSLNMK
jgi:hypothetical protein